MRPNVPAIPAMVIYNIFARPVAGYRLRFGDLSTLVLALASPLSDRASIRATARPLVLLRNAAE